MGSRLRFPRHTGRGDGASGFAPAGAASLFEVSAAAPLRPRASPTAGAAHACGAAADRRPSHAAAASRRLRAAFGWLTASAERRRQTAAEERLNTLSHGIGFVAAAAAWPMLSDHAAQRGGALAALGIAVFCLAAMLVYAASMLYHALPDGRAKDWARRIDHASIFVFIAGSYTPFALGPLHGGIGGPLLAGVWGVALLGAGCKVGGRLRHRLASTLLYAALGWMALALLGPLAARAGGAAVPWLLAGGVAYTLGALFYLADDRLRFGHFVWHLAVLAGSGCHVLAALATMG